jgi:hypothetical protein
MSRHLCLFIAALTAGSALFAAPQDSGFPGVQKVRWDLFADDPAHWLGSLSRKATLLGPVGESVDELKSSIATDRPDFTESSTTVPAGSVQIETGYTVSTDDDSGPRVTSHSFPEALFRVGTSLEWLELRLATNVSGETAPENSGADFEDLYLGTKIAMCNQDGLIPELAVMPQMTVPTGGSSVTADRTLPGVNILYGWDLTDSLSTAGSTQVNRTVDDDGSACVEWAQSWTVGFGLTEQLGAYTEWFAFFPDSGTAADTQHYGNGGLTWLFNDDLQADVRAGFGLNEAADDFFAGVGLSWRYR